MWKSIIYKEWIKTRWVACIFTLLGLLVIGNIFLKVQHDFTFNKASIYWHTILFRNHQFYNYSLFKYTPALGALAIAFAQFFPETVNKRIKLSFHLPLNENKILIHMSIFGTTCLLAIYLFILLFFISMNMLFFPFEIVTKTFISIIPWFLSGFAIYYFVSLIILEPVWKFRFLYAITSLTLIPIYLEKAALGSYTPLIPLLLCFTLLLSISLLFSGYRFRKGEMQ